MEVQDHQDLQEALVLPDKVVLLEVLVHLGLLVKTELLDLRVAQDHQDKLVVLDRPDLAELQELGDLQEPLVLMELLDHQDPLVLLAKPAEQDPPEVLVLLVKLEEQDHQEHQELGFQ
jgi:hypothetical protein